jgi:hypothetical protein
MDSLDTWRKSKYSGNSGNCVEVADTARRVLLVRDTKDREGGALAFTADAWQTFTGGLKQP